VTNFISHEAEVEMYQSARKFLTHDNFVHAIYIYICVYIYIYIYIYIYMQLISTTLFEMFFDVVNIEQNTI